MSASTSARRSVQGWPLLAALLLGLGLPACAGPAGEYCDLACECQGCSDREYDECVVYAQEQIDLANAYDCGDDIDAVIECSLDRNHCDNDVFYADDSCQNDVEDLGHCIADNSSLYDHIATPDPPTGG
jgi:hypothetical protein